MGFPVVTMRSMGDSCKGILCMAAKGRGPFGWECSGAGEGVGVSGTVSDGQNVHCWLAGPATGSTEGGVRLGKESPRPVAVLFGAGKEADRLCWSRRGFRRGCGCLSDAAETERLLSLGSCGPLRGRPSKATQRACELLPWVFGCFFCRLSFRFCSFSCYGSEKKRIVKNCGIRQDRLAL